MLDGWLFMFRNTFNRDLIVFDQWGTGYSQPVLNCPELEEPFYELLESNLSMVEEDQRIIVWIHACNDRLAE